MADVSERNVRPFIKDRAAKEASAKDGPVLKSKPESARCPSCGFNFISRISGKCKMRTRLLVFTKNGNAMGICPKCKAKLKVPITLEA